MEKLVIDWSVAQFCVNCGHEMRKSKSPNDGRRPHYSKGKCSKCYYLERSEGTHRLYDWSVDRFCTGCHKLLRPGGTKADGKTVAHCSQGKCESCFQRTKRASAGAKSRTPLIYDERGQVCKYCETHKTFDQFPVANHNPTGRRSKCFRCQSLWDSYRLTSQEFEEYLTKQDNKCASCSVPFTGVIRPNVDHDHDCCPGERTCGGCVRGLLCRKCNTILGHVGDSILLMEQLTSYLKVTIHTTKKR